MLAAGPVLEGCGAIKRALSPAPDVEIALSAVPADVNILPGHPTRVWQYQGKVTRGDPDTLQNIPGSYLGPIFRFKQGQRVRIVFTNNLPEQSIIHWHGMWVPDDMDGHPRFAVGPGKSYEYEYEVINRAGTYWYHPHPDTLTGHQVYQGMAGLLLVSDEEEAAAGLPSGDFEIPLVIQDRQFDEQNQFVYFAQGTNEQTMGFLGETIMVNGKAAYTLDVATRPYRFRILNGSNSRIYKLGWKDGTPLNVIGTDGGLLDKPASKPYVMLAPAERVDLWVDFSGRDVGTELLFQSLTFDGVACASVSSLGG